MDSTVTEADKFVDEQGAAEFLTVKPQTLSVWRLKGSGPPFHKIGRCVRYSIADLRDYIASRRCTNTAEADSLGS